MRTFKMKMNEMENISRNQQAWCGTAGVGYVTRCWVPRTSYVLMRNRHGRYYCVVVVVVVVCVCVCVCGGGCTDPRVRVWGRSARVIWVRS